MRLSRFRDMVATYGAAPERWPEREAALRLLEESAEARAALHEAQRVDGALDGFAAAVDPDAMARLSATVQRRVARMPAAEAGRPWRFPPLVALSLRFGAFVAMAAVGVWIGWSQPMAAANPDPLAPLLVYPVPDDLP